MIDPQLTDTEKAVIEDVLGDRATARRAAQKTLQGIGWRASMLLFLAAILSSGANWVSSVEAEVQQNHNSEQTLRTADLLAQQRRSFAQKHQHCIDTRRTIFLDGERDIWKDLASIETAHNAGKISEAAYSSRRVAAFAKFLPIIDQVEKMPCPRDYR
jgi:hypothetical protein